jgi:1-deoxy-D-xylulose-5-phosphate reductoisomerase
LLPLAYEAAGKAGLYPTAYNAADEIAVQAFFSKGLRFMDIFQIVRETLQSDWIGGDDSIESILDGDRRARLIAERVVDSRLEATS